MSDDKTSKSEGETDPALYEISIDVLGLSDNAKKWLLTVESLQSIGDCVDSAKRYLYLSVSRIHIPSDWYDAMEQLVRKLEKQGYLEDPLIETLGLSPRTIKILKSTGMPCLRDCIYVISRHTDPKLGFTMPEKVSHVRERDLFDAIKTDVIPRLIELGYLNKDGSVPKG